MFNTKLQVFKVGDNVRLARVQFNIGVFLQHGDTGVITQVTSDGYTVNFTINGLIRNLKDGDLELVSRPQQVKA